MKDGFIFRGTTKLEEEEPEKAWIIGYKADFKLDLNKFSSYFPTTHYL